MGEAYKVTVGFFGMYYMDLSLTKESYQRLKDSSSLLTKNSWEMMTILHASMTDFFFFSKHIRKCTFYLGKKVTFSASQNCKKIWHSQFQQIIFKVYVKV